jgi:hypothetical protein
MSQSRGSDIEWEIPPLPPRKGDVDQDGTAFYINQADHGVGKLQGKPRLTKKSKLREGKLFNGPTGILTNASKSCDYAKLGRAPKI